MVMVDDARWWVMVINDGLIPTMLTVGSWEFQRKITPTYTSSSGSENNTQQPYNIHGHLSPQLPVKIVCRSPVQTPFGPGGWMIQFPCIDVSVITQTSRLGSVHSNKPGQPWSNPSQANHRIFCFTSRVPGNFITSISLRTCTRRCLALTWSQGKLMKP